MRFVCLLLLSFYSRLTDCVKKPVLNQARALSSSLIYLSWKGPIDHPGGFKYRIYLKKGSSPIRKHADISGSAWYYILKGLKGNIRYTVCVGLVDRYDKTNSICHSSAIITMPAQRGHVSRTDRKYLTKGEYYQAARHYWPFDYETNLRDIKYSVAGAVKGSGVSIMGKGRGFLTTNGSGWIRMGRFKNECLCDARYCRKDGFSVSLWVKLSSFENRTKVLLGSDDAIITKTTGLVIFQSTRATGNRYVSAVVFMVDQKWKCRSQVEPGTWFYLTVTWKESTGLRMYKDGFLMSARKRSKHKPYPRRWVNHKCAVSLSPKSANTPLVAHYDDLVVWYYELNSTEIADVLKSSYEPPKVKECKTKDGKSLNIVIEDDNVYEMKNDYKVSWIKTGDRQGHSNRTNNRAYHISGLETSSEYSITVQRRIRKNMFSRASEIICNTRLRVPSKPRKFRVREKSSDYLFLRWQPPEHVYGIIRGYKISYRVNDFTNSKWIAYFQPNVQRIHLYDLKPFTDYVIKLLCQNDEGSGAEAIIEATTGEGVPDAPRRLRVSLKRNFLFIKWKEPLNMNGKIDYRVFVSVDGNTTMVCNHCGQYYKMDDIDQNTTYTFWVVAYNVNNDSRFVSQGSNNFTITTPSFTPSVPRSVVANLTYNGIQVLWTEPKTPNGDVDYRLTGLVNESRNVFCSKCGLSYLVTNVSRNTVYSFWVVAYNVRKGYESAESAKVDIDTTLFVPSDPSSVTVAFSPEGILVSWNKSHVSQGVIQYKLFAMVNGSRRLLCSKCGLKYLIKNVEHNVNYFVWVTAYNVQNGYESASSPVVHFSTTGLKPQAPENLLAPEIKDGSATIRWNPPGGTAQDGDGDIIGYKVTLYDGHKIIRTIITQSLQLEFKNLTQFSKYYVTVQVLSKAGVYGPPSAQLVIQTEDKDECLESETPCSKHAVCTNSLGSFFCSCLPMYIGDGVNCEALPVDTTNSDFCPGEHARNITWKRTFRGHSDKNLCPNGTVGISTRKCINGNGTRSYWADPNLSNCVSAWMTAMDDKLADPTLNSSVVGDFFLNLLDENLKRGLYGGDVIKSVEVIDILYNKSKDNELDEQRPNPELAKNVVETFVNITQNIISPKTLKVWKDIPKNRRTENGAKMIESLENAVVQSAKIVNYSSIQNEHMDVRYGDVTSFESKYKRLFPLDEDYNELNSIKFPQSLQKKRKDTTGRTSVAVIKYKTIGSVLSAGDHEASDEEFLNSAVLSVTMDPPLPSPFQEPLEFLLKNQEDGKFDNQKCVFFNTSRYPGSWSTNGCVVFNASADFTVCHCYHMTSFSVLMQVSDVELSYSDALILGWITRIGLCISLIALGFAFITFMCLPRPCGYRNGSKCFKLCEAGYRPTYLKKVRTSIHSNLIFSLALGEALFLWGIEKTGDKVTCYTVAVSLHYLFLVAFHWMAAEGVILYLVLVKVFQRKSAKKDKRMFMVICWGTPAAIVCISLAVGYENYLHEKCCWLSVTHGLIWSFAGPALTIILVNVFFLCCTFRVMGKRQRWEKKEKHMADRIRYWAKGAAIVTCLLGVTWIFGVFFINSDSVVLAYLFNICNVFQGLFIFVFHCLLDEKIRQRYYQVFCAVPNGESRSHSHSTGTIKKERRRSTFNSWLWTLAPAKFQDSKSESCPTVGENILKRLESQSTHSLSHSPNIGRKLQEIKMQGLRPRGMSSIYHDSDENMDNIPDKIVIVKHNSRTNNETLECEENSTAGMFPSEDYWISTLSRENSQQFLQVPQMTCEDCLYEVREWEDQQELEIRKTNSLHEQELKKHIAPSSTNSQEESKSDTDDESSDEETTDNSVEEINKDKTTKKYTTFTTVVPQIILSDYTNKEVISTSKVSQMVQMINSKSREGNSQKKLFGSTAV